ncbi:hypothetical protein F4825DRAFT_115341 [Nemania diffusa]|nr:hypothetical protein F4825DRAFT_115341 [Nemania diffusa]
MPFSDIASQSRSKLLSLLVQLHVCLGDSHMTACDCRIGVQSGASVKINARGCVSYLDTYSQGEEVCKYGNTTKAATEIKVINNF